MGGLGGLCQSRDCFVALPRHALLLGLLGLLGLLELVGLLCRQKMQVCLTPADSGRHSGLTGRIQDVQATRACFLHWRLDRVLPAALALQRCHPWLPVIQVASALCLRHLPTSQLLCYAPPGSSKTSAWQALASMSRPGACMTKLDKAALLANIQARPSQTADVSGTDCSCVGVGRW